MTLEASPLTKPQTRRHFLGSAAAGTLAFSISATTRARAVGANERLRIGLIGCGSRGIGSLMKGIHQYTEDQNAEVVAVCDPWRQHREEAVAKAKEWFGVNAGSCVSYTDLLSMEDLDAVIIASCDHQHTAHLEASAKAGKDIYCEKPLAMDLEKLKSACDAVKEAGSVAQVGTQLRSLPSMTGAKALYETGALGRVARIEQCRNSAQPYWYSYLTGIEKEDVDWKEFLHDRPMRPFDPHVYSGWYGYREFSDGPVPGLGSHFMDLVHYITGATFPTSCVCSGGVFTWKDKYDFTCPDHVQAQWIYPEGFLVTYSTNFGNGSGNSFKFFGNEGVMDLVKWNSPAFSNEGTLAGKSEKRIEKPIDPVPGVDHMRDWLECIRNRKTPNASIDAGYQHAVAVIMAMKAYDTGRRQVYDRENRQIIEG